MIRAIVHQGFIGKEIEYFAVVAGPEVDRRFFFEQITNPRGDVVRYFGGGCELVLNPEGVRFKGNGGIFGEYMFGGHLPVDDLLNDEVVNRLVLFGATMDPKTGIRFTYNTDGFETYDNLFLQGNAIANYVFFIEDRKRYDDVTDRQAKTLRNAGKLLKRSRRVGVGQFINLAHEILEALEEPGSTLVMLRVVNLANQKFAERCREAYAAHTNVEELIADDIELGRVEAYQRERIQIDVIYHDPANQELIDEYKRILASCAGSIINPSARARLMRIRTLSLRNEVPLSIFDTLEEIVLQEPRAPSDDAEPDYIQTTREILGGFLLGKNIRRKLSSLDMVQLMEN
ncbi:MAG TPA: TIGR04442 family protein, partial [Thermoanaerobaculia bacterium]|nr:TIGR04442 family protein [Thermoanaerobaculia bacterium]